MPNSLCTPPSLAIPNPSDILAAIVAALEALHLWPPPSPFPTITPPWLEPFCPLD